MLPTHFTNMHLIRMIMVWVFMAVTAAQPHCDPRTQYEKNGECCRMCGPGTRMLSPSTCLDPHCVECGPDKYQDAYTREHLCELQPYCDPHKNFEVVDHKSKKHRSPCRCKEGFHCAGAECVTCVGHTTCKPGQGAHPKGNHSHDTKCQKCTEGTFSDVDSWDGVCKKWTECADESQIQQRGTNISDTICKTNSRTHEVVITLLLLMVVVGGVIIFFICRGKIKACFGSHLEEKREPLRETKVLITNPTDPIDESTLPELQSSQEECGVRTPEENEDGMSQEASGDVVLTENGNFVTQENGKSSILSRQESQPQT